MRNKKENWETNLEATKLSSQEVRRDRMKSPVITLKGRKYAWDTNKVELSERDD